MPEYWEVDEVFVSCGLAKGNRLDITNDGIEVNQSGAYWGENYSEEDGTVDYDNVTHSLEEKSGPKLSCNRGGTDGTVWTAVEGGGGGGLVGRPDPPARKR